MIVVADYGSGNIRSVEKALSAVGADVRRISSPEEMDAADGLVVPGVGAFDDCIQALEKRNLLVGIRKFIDSGRPFLGICVGYQALFERSEEFGSCANGLGIFKGSVVRFKDQPGLKVPQIGWNQVKLNHQDCPLFSGIPDQSYFYFVHSFYPQPKEPEIETGRTTYGGSFVSAVWRGNVFATQFHPEKSQEVGLQLLRNFVGIAAAPKG
ncbi:MAG TPA: imidazole glycerol phosphate synthase subunit HisH [Verrucomicrobiales bacterium]|nr:imidazole glycerol phosphate synthase subunit HisH [Verrucomicrobiales bacterium]HIL72227.1 imidazole glycerol phosphate synthase subunit HisH [Verrucomicrobiota bacterium]